MQKRWEVFHCAGAWWFSICDRTILIIGTVVVIKQMQYFRSRPMGFDKDGIALINLPSDSSLKVKYPMLKSRMEALPGVTFCKSVHGSTFQWLGLDQ